jgi:hypothetical protein
MDTLLGAILGAAIGLAHAGYLWRSATRAFSRSIAVPGRSLFGSYVLLLWLIGVAASGLSPREAGKVD